MSLTPGSKYNSIFLYAIDTRFNRDVMIYIKLVQGKKHIQHEGVFVERIRKKLPRYLNFALLDLKTPLPLIDCYIKFENDTELVENIINHWRHLEYVTHYIYKG